MTAALFLHYFNATFFQVKIGVSMFLNAIQTFSSVDPLTPSILDAISARCSKSLETNVMRTVKPPTVHEQQWDKIIIVFSSPAPRCAICFIASFLDIPDGPSILFLSLRIHVAFVISMNSFNNLHSSFGKNTRWCVSRGL